MSNWQYAQQVPTEVWRSAMTIPRSLALIEADGQYSLHSQPIKELNQLRTSSEHLKASKFDLKSDIIELECYTGSGDFKLVFSNDKNEEVVLEKKGDQIIFDRTKSGITTFNENFPKVHTSPVDGIDIKNVRIFLDRSSMEIFFNEGALVLTELVFPTVPYSTVETQGLGDDVTIHQLKSIWNQ
ncbi:MAG: hypothetical protein RIR48_1947, partial [Bacteroidota bacterium]